MRDSNAPGWADRPETKRLIRILLYAACGILLLAEFLIHRHVYNAVEGVPLIYALYGFAALVVAVTIAKVMRILLKRHEKYYD